MFKQRLSFKVRPAHCWCPDEWLGDLGYVSGASLAFLKGVDGADVDPSGGAVDDLAEMLCRTGGAENGSECARPAEMLEGGGRSACCTVNE